MPTYRITDPQSGRTLRLTGDSPPTEKELNEIFAQQQLSPQQPIQQEQQPNIIQQMLEAGIAGPLGQSSGRQVMGNVLNSLASGPVKTVGRAMQGVESMVTGKQPTNFTVPFPGGGIDIKPATGIMDAVMPGVDTALMLASGPLAQGVNKIIKFDNALIQARQAKISLDAVRDTYGQAKEIAMQEIKDLPVKFDWKDIPSMAKTKLANPDYGIAFDQEGKIVNTVGNLDKVKLALQDIPSTKDYVEAGNISKAKVMQFAGKVRDAIVDTANEAGKPQLAKALKDYHNFMDNYDLANKSLTDNLGNAMANKLKHTFRLHAEPVVKEAWKNIGEVNPEIKSIIKSRTNRELLKTLLVTAPTVESGKRIITGRW
jgi:hypothetical protein